MSSRRLAAKPVMGELPDDKAADQACGLGILRPSCCSVCGGCRRGSRPIEEE